MTRSELQQLLDHIPDSVLDDNRGQLIVTSADLQELNDVVVALADDVVVLANKLGALTLQWMQRQREWTESQWRT